MAEKMETKKVKKIKKQTYWSSHHFLGHDAQQSFTSGQTLRTKVLHLSSGSKNRPSEGTAIKNVCGILLVYMTSQKIVLFIVITMETLNII